MCRQRLSSYTSRSIDRHLLRRLRPFDLVVLARLNLVCAAILRDTVEDRATMRGAACRRGARFRWSQTPPNNRCRCTCNPQQSRLQLRHVQSSSIHPSTCDISSDNCERCSRLKVIHGHRQRVLDPERNRTHEQSQNPNSDVQMFMSFVFFFAGARSRCKETLRTRTLTLAQLSDLIVPRCHHQQPNALHLHVASACDSHSPANTRDVMRAYAMERAYMYRNDIL